MSSSTTTKSTTTTMSRRPPSNRDRGEGNAFSQQRPHLSGRTLTAAQLLRERTPTSIPSSSLPLYASIPSPVLSLSLPPEPERSSLYDDSRSRTRSHAEPAPTSTTTKRWTGAGSGSGSGSSARAPVHALVSASDGSPLAYSSGLAGSFVSYRSSRSPSASSHQRRGPRTSSSSSSPSRSRSRSSSMTTLPRRMASERSWERDRHRDDDDEDEEDEEEMERDGGRPEQRQPDASLVDAILRGGAATRERGNVYHHVVVEEEEEEENREEVYLSSKSGVRFLLSHGREREEPQRPSMPIETDSNGEVGFERARRKESLAGEVVSRARREEQAAREIQGTVRRAQQVEVAVSGEGGGIRPVQVVIRLRPIPSAHVQDPPICEISDDMQTLSLSKDLFFQRKRDYPLHKFSFDRSFPSKTTQQVFYRKCIRPAVATVCQGIPATVFLYGEGKSGKTFTLEGALDSVEHTERGIIPRAVEDLFEFTSQYSNGGRLFGLSASFLEISNEVVTDILRPESGSLKLFEDRDRGATSVIGLTERELHSPVDIFDILRRRPSSRTSRERCSTIVLTITLDMASAPRPASHSRSIPTSDMSGNRSISPISRRLLEPSFDRTGSVSGLSQSVKLSFVELPGSDSFYGKNSQKRTSHTSSTKAASSSRVFSAISSVLNNLHHGVQGGHVPYRQSKLTHILRDGLNVDSLILLVGTLHSSLPHFDESLATCKYLSMIRENTQMLKTLGRIPDLGFYLDEDMDAVLFGTSSLLSPKRNSFSERVGDVDGIDSSLGFSNRRSSFFIDESDTDLLATRHELSGLRAQHESLLRSHEDVLAENHTLQVELSRVREERDQLRDWLSDRFLEAVQDAEHRLKLQAELERISEVAQQRDEERAELWQSASSSQHLASSKGIETESLRSDVLSLRTELAKLRERCNAAELEAAALRAQTERDSDRIREYEMATAHWRSEFTRADREKHRLRLLCLERGDSIGNISLSASDIRDVVVSELEQELASANSRYEEATHQNRESQIALDRAEREIAELRSQRNVHNTTIPNDLSSEDSHRLSDSFIPTSESESMDSVQHLRNASILQPPVYPRKARSASNIEQGGGSRRFVVSDLDRLMHEVDTALMNEVESEEVESSSKFNVGSDSHSPSSPTEQQLSGESSDSESEFESASMNDNTDDLPPVSEPLTSGSVRETSEPVESVPESSSSALERKQVSAEDNPLGIRSRVDSVVRLQRARSFALPIPDELARSGSFLERARSGSVRQLLLLPSPTEESGVTSTTPIADSQQDVLSCMDEMTNSLRRRISELEADLDAATQARAEAESRAERATVSGSPRSVELKLEQLSQNRDRAERDARHFELIVQELSGKRDELAHEIEQTNTIILARDREIELLRKANNEYRQQVRRLVEERDTLAAAASNIETSADQSSLLPSSSENSNASLSQRQRSGTASRLQLQTQHRIQLLTRENERLQKELLTRVHELDEGREELKRMELDLVEAKSETKLLRTAKEKLQQEVNRSSSGVRESISEIERLRNDLREAERKAQIAERCRGVFEELACEESLLSMMQNSMSDAVHKLVVLQGSQLPLPELPDRLRLLLLSWMNIDRQGVALQEQLRSVEEEKQSILISFREVQQELQELADDYESLDCDFKRLETDYAASQKTLGMTQAELRSAIDSRGQSTSLNERLNSVVRSFESRVKTLESQRRMLEENSSRLQSECDAFEDRNQSLEDDLAETRDLLEKASLEASTWRSGHELLSVELNSTRSFVSRAHSVLESMLSVLSSTSTETDTAVEDDGLQDTSNHGTSNLENDECSSTSPPTSPMWSPTSGPLDLSDLSAVATPATSMTNNEAGNSEVSAEQESPRASKSIVDVSNGVAALSERVFSAIEGFSIEFSRLRSENACLEENVSGLSEQLDQARSELSEAVRDAGLLRSRVESLDESLSSLKKSNNSLEKERHQLETALLSSERQVMHLQEDLSEKSQIAQSAETRLRDCETELDSIRKQSWDYETAVQKLSFEVDMLRQENNRLIAEVERSRESREMLRKELADRSSEVQRHVDERQESQLRLAEMTTEKERIERERDRLVREISGLEEVLSSVRESESGLHAQIIHLQQELGTARSKLEDADEEASTIRTRMEQLEMDLNDCRSESTTRKQEFTALKNEYESVSNTASIQAQRADNLENVKKSLSKQLADARVESYREKESLLERIQTLEREHTHANRERNLMSDKLREAEDEMEHARKSCKELTQKLKGLEVERHGLALRLAEVENSSRESRIEIDALRAQLLQRDRQTELDTSRAVEISQRARLLEEEDLVLRNECENLRNTILRLETELHVSRSSAASKDERISRLEMTNSRLSKQVSEIDVDYQSVSRTAETSTAELSHLRRDLHVCRSERDDLQSQVSLLRSTLDKTIEERDEIRSHYSQTKALLSTRSDEKEKLYEESLRKEVTLRELSLERDALREQISRLSVSSEDRVVEISKLRERLQLLESELSTCDDERLRLRNLLRECESSLDRERRINAKTSRDLQNIITAFGLSDTQSRSSPFTSGVSPVRNQQSPIRSSSQNDTLSTVGIHSALSPKSNPIAGLLQSQRIPTDRFPNTEPLHVSFSE